MQNYLNDIFLEKVFSFTKETWEKNSLSGQGYNYIQISSNDTDDIYKYMVSILNFDSKPKVVKDEVYNLIDDRPVFRGSTKLAYHDNLLNKQKGEYHYGAGYTSGIYTNFKQVNALQYTIEKENINEDIEPQKYPEKVLEMKLDNPKYIHYHTLENMAEMIRHGSFDSYNQDIQNKLSDFVEFMCNIENINDCQNFLNIFLNDLSKLAIYLGYEAIANDVGFIVLNRGKIVVSESESARIKNGSTSEQIKEIVHRETSSSTNLQTALNS